MRHFTLVTMFILIALKSYSQTANTVDGQFSTNIVGSTYQVTIQANMQLGTGSAGIVAIDFTFNNLGLSIPDPPVIGVDYILQGDFASYPTHNITRPSSNKVSVNLASFTPASLSTTPTAIILLNFNIIDAGKGLLDFVGPLDNNN